MPLTSTKKNPIGTGDYQAVGVAMMDGDNEVLIYASRDLLDMLGGMPLFGTFQENREQIERLAGRKYEAHDFDQLGRVMVKLEDWPD